MSKDIYSWANDWVIEKLTTEEHDSPHNLIPSEVARFVNDANTDGISRDDLEDTLGDLENYLTEEYQRKINEETAERAGRGD